MIPVNSYSPIEKRNKLPEQQERKNCAEKNCINFLVSHNELIISNINLYLEYFKLFFSNHENNTYRNVHTVDLFLWMKCLHDLNI